MAGERQPVRPRLPAMPDESDEPMPARAADGHRHRHVIVCGVDHLGLRTIDELALGEETVVAVAPAADPDWEHDHPGVQLVVGDYRREKTLAEAGVATAAAIMLTGEDDLGNLHAALAASAINPSIRIVLRLFDAELGSQLELILPNAVGLSSSAIAAPAYVAAALDGEAGVRFAFGDRVVVTRRASDPRDPSIGAPLMSVAIARLHVDRSVEPLPDEGPADKDSADRAFADDDLVVAETFEPAAPAAGDYRRRWLGADVEPLIVVASRVNRMRARLIGGLVSLPGAVPARIALPDRRLVRFASLILVVALASALFFAVSAGLSPLDAFGYAISLLTGASSAFGIDAAAASGTLKVYTIVLSLLGAAVIAIVYALITDAIVRSRLLQTLGARVVPRTIRDHVIICGLGTIGYRVALGIKARGVPVVVVQDSDDNGFVAAARAAGIPVVIGDASLPGVLDDLGLKAARALVTVTTDDLVNLTVALNARAVRPDLRVVVRVYDPDFAARVRHGFGIRFTRSVSHLAAPAFAAATIDCDVAASIPVGDRRVVLFARLTIAAGSRAEGALAATMEAPGRRRLLAIVDPDGRVRWVPPHDEILDAGESVLVAASRAGLAEFVELARAPG